MAPSNAIEKWVDQSIMSLCNFLIEYQNTNGRSKGFPWIQLQPEYEKIHNHKFINKQALKSKFDIMRKQYTLWKQLTWRDRSRLGCKYRGTKLFSSVVGYEN